MSKRGFDELSKEAIEGSERPESHTESWQGAKPTLEDRHINAVKLPGGGWLWGLYDGHGGTKCPEFVQKSLHRYVIEEVTARLDKAKSDARLEEDCLKNALRAAFRKCDTEYLEMARRKNADDGSTALVVVLIESSGGGRRLVVCNAGDSRAVLCRGGQAVRLSEDHKPDRPSERRRIEGLGGTVVKAGSVWRVTNTTSADLGSNKKRAHLATSRSIGDRDLKEPPLVTSEPEFKSFDVGDKDAYIVMACDGIWDVFGDQQVIDIVNAEATDLEAASRALNRKAMQNHSEDNLTSTIIALQNATSRGEIINESNAKASRPEEEEEIDMFA